MSLQNSFSRRLVVARDIACNCSIVQHRGDAAKAGQDDDRSGGEWHGDPPLNATQRSDGVSEHSTIFSSGHQIWRYSPGWATIRILCDYNRSEPPAQIRKSGLHVRLL